MKKYILILVGLGFMGLNAQNEEIKNHYQNYYELTKKIGDLRGSIEALSHLFIYDQSEPIKDTLAFLYANSNQQVQAINILGTDSKSTDSDLSVRVKAVSLKALNQNKLALSHYEELFKRDKKTVLAYELADIYLSLSKLSEANAKIDYGLSNAKSDEKYTYFNSQNPYAVSLKSAFTYLKALHQFNKNKTDYNAAIKLLDDAIVMSPNFAEAKQVKELLLRKKQEDQIKNSQNKK